MTLGTETYNPFIHGERPAPPDAASRQEQYPDALSLPGNKELTDRLINEAQIALANKPIRQIPDFTQADIIIDDETATPDNVRKTYANKAGTKLADGQWWSGLEPGLNSYGFSEVLPLALQVSREHDFDIQQEDGRGPKGSIKVYECGPGTTDELTDRELETLQTTLTAIDQLSSGQLLNDKGSANIVFLEGVPLSHQEDADKELQGFSSNELTAVNVSYLRRLAQEHDADFGAVLSLILVHELLGHRLEAATEVRPGDLFSRHFDYSEERTSSEHSGAVHAEITPKDPSITSEAVREYGQQSAAEDLATAVEASVSQAMGWQAEVNKIPLLKGEADRHRSELVLGLLQKIARKSRMNGPADGAATPLAYRSDGLAGEQVLGPARQFLRRTKGIDEIAQEIENTFAQWRTQLAQKPEIIYAPPADDIG